MTDTDKANALDWLNEIVTNPGGWRMFYSDSETKTCAEATLELLKERGTVTPAIHRGAGDIQWYICSECQTPLSPGNCFCGGCGKLVKWDETPI